MARVSGASMLAWLWRLRRLLSDAQRAPTRSSVSRMLLPSPVAMGIGCFRKQESTLPCCSSGYTTHGASSFLSSGIKFSPCTRHDQCFSAYSEKIVDFDRKAKLKESISAAFISNTAPYTTEEWDPELVVSDGSSWSQQYQSTSQLAFLAVTKSWAPVTNCPIIMPSGIYVGAASTEIQAKKCAGSSDRERMCPAQNMKCLFRTVKFLNGKEPLNGRTYADNCYVKKVCNNSFSPAPGRGLLSV